MASLLQVLAPELILVIAASALFLLGTINAPGARRFAPLLALAACIVVFGIEVCARGAETSSDAYDVVRLTPLTTYVKLIVSGMGGLLVLLAWPTSDSGSDGPAISFGGETAEFFGLMLLSLTGVCLVAGANDLILLFLGIELASIPTYVMVSVSRPIPVAQEAGVKYFFLGAMAAAIMLFGFSYLYGTTGSTRLDQIADTFRFNAPASSLTDPALPDVPGMGHAIRGTMTMAAPPLLPAALSCWQLLAVVLVLGGFAFKMAAVPLHAYAGDVYTGAATPVTAFLSFVPKTSGLIATMKILFVAGGNSWAVPHVLVTLVWVIAVLTMSVGNVLGLLAMNVKRVLAYSSVANSGYMLSGVAALLASRGQGSVQVDAAAGVLFYLAAYGVTNVAAFGVLSLLPSRHQPRPPATTAETFEDLAGTGRQHPWLAVAMAIACFSLIGLPLTVGFLGKAFLVKPIFESRSYWLGLILLVNAAVAAAYYLKIVGVMVLRPVPLDLSAHPPTPRDCGCNNPIVMAVCLSTAIVLLVGIVPPAVNACMQRGTAAATPIGRSAAKAVAEGGAKRQAMTSLLIGGSSQSPASPQAGSMKSRPPAG